MSYLTNALTLIAEVAFDLAATLLALRLLAEFAHVDFRNPLSQWLYRFSNPVVAPLRRVLPHPQRINLAALLILWLVMLLKRLALLSLAGALPTLPGLLMLSLADLLDFLLLTAMVLVFASSLLSMVQPEGYHPLPRFAQALADPMLRPLRGKLVVGMFDFSPLAVLVLLMLARALIAQPLYDWGTRLLVGM